MNNFRDLENQICSASEWNRGSPLAAEHIRRFRAGAIQQRNAMCIACQQGDASVVDFLVNCNPKLCFQRDSWGLIPVQIAVINGHSNVLHRLIQANPPSAHCLTRENQTLFHLSALSGHSHLFQALLLLLPPSDQQKLLHKQDDEGNTVLHVATAKQLISVVNLLTSHPLCPFIGINSLNKQRMTALDICHDNLRCLTMLEISVSLRAAGALKACSIHHRARYDAKNLPLLVVTVVLGALFTSISNPPASLFSNLPANDHSYELKELLLLQLHAFFYFLLANIRTAIGCVVAIVNLTWSIPYRKTVHRITICWSVVFSIIVTHSMPKFSISFGSLDIGSRVMLWLLATSSLIALFLAYNLLAKVFSFLYKFVN